MKYKVYYLKKGGSGKFPECTKTKSEQAVNPCEYGFLDTTLPTATLKKLAIYEVFSKEEKVEK